MQIKMLCALAVTAVCSLHAQAQRGQLRAGVNFANVSVTDDGRVDDARTLTSFQVGFIGNLQLIPKVLSLQPGIIFTGKGSKTESGNSNSANFFRATSNPFYIEVPVNAIVRLPLGKESGVFVGAGPYVAVGIAGKNKVEGRTPLGSFESERDIRFSDDDPTTLNYQEGAGFAVMRRFDYGINGTAGIDLKTIVLAANYGLGLAKLQSTADNNNDRNKHRVLSLTVGIKL